MCGGHETGRPVGRWRPASPSVGDTFIVPLLEASAPRLGVIVLDWVPVDSVVHLVDCSGNEPTGIDVGGMPVLIGG